MDQRSENFTAILGDLDELSEIAERNMKGRALNLFTEVYSRIYESIIEEEGRE